MPETEIARLEAEIRQISEELAKAYEEINFLYELSRDLNSTLDIEALCRIAMEKAKAMIPAESGSIRLLTEYYKLKNYFGWGPLKELGDIYLDQGIIGQVFGTGRPILLNDVEHSPYNEIKLLNYSSFLGVPLVSATSEVIGVIILANFSQGKRFLAVDKSLLVSLATQTAVAIEGSRYHQHMMEQNRLDEDLRVAKRIQNNLLPDQIPSSYPLEIAAFYETAREVGGDYFDFFTLNQAHDLPVPDPSKLGFALGDVMGKGIGAAMVMAMARSVLKASILSHPSPAKIMSALNQSLYEDIEKAGFYLTFWYGQFDFKTYQLTFSSSGNPPFLLFSPTGESSEFVAANAMLGVSFDTQFSESTIGLKEGEILLFFTDGVSEAKSLEGELFGLDRLKSLVKENIDKAPEEIKTAVYQRIKEFCGEALSDDMALIVMRVK